MFVGKTIRHFKKELDRDLSLYYRTSGGPLDRPHVLPGPMIQLMVHPNPEFCPGLPLPSAFLKQSMTVGPPAPKKPRKEDIQAKMMSLAQSVLTEERGPAFLLEKELGDLTEEVRRILCVLFRRFWFAHGF